MLCNAHPIHFAPYRTGLTIYPCRESLVKGPLAFATQAGQALSDVPAVHLQRILLVYYHLLMADPETPTCLGWSTTLLQSIYRPTSSSHPDGAVRWLVPRCLGLQTHLPEATGNNPRLNSWGLTLQVTLTYVLARS